MRMIDKEALLERLDLFICEYDRMDQEEAIEEIRTVIKAVKMMPETRHSKWVRTKNLIISYKCSICGYETEVAQMRYCPNCGARMENVK